MRFLNRWSGISMNRGHNVILVNIRETVKQFIELNTTASRAVNGSLRVRVGINIA